MKPTGAIIVGQGNVRVRNLADNSEIIIPITDAAGNPFPGILDNTGGNFTTAINRAALTARIS